MPDGICPFATQVLGVRTFAPGYVTRAGFCDHTAGGFYTTLLNPDFWNQQGVSTHFGISRKGEICQMVNIFDTAWAQGLVKPPVTWTPYATLGSGNPNGYLISTEHEDAVTVNGKTQFVPGSQWTPEQYAADLRVKQWCIEEVRRVAQLDLMAYGIDSLAGHHMFDAVTRAECPGRFWRDYYRAQLFKDLTPRTWLYGNESAGAEVVGSQLFYWHHGVVINKVGDEAGQFPGARYHNEGGVFRQVEL